MAKPPDIERYEPMPSLLELPGWLLRKLSPRARRATIAVVALLVAGLTAALVLVALPAESRRDASRRSLEHRQLLARLAQVRGAQRPRPFALPGVAGRGEAAVRAAIERRVAATARTGRATCTPTIGAPPLTFNCGAIRARTRLSVVSTPYSAHVDPRTGRGAICQVVPPPGVPSAEELGAYRLSRACGGLGR